MIKKVTAVLQENLTGDLIQPGHPLFGLVWINRERVSGTPCFYGTRVPIKTPFDSLAAGQSMEEFLDDFEAFSGSKPNRCLNWLHLSFLMTFLKREDLVCFPSCGCDHVIANSVSGPPIKDQS